MCWNEPNATLSSLRLLLPQVDFYNAVSVLYSTLAEFCSERSCEVMSAGAKVGRG